MINKGEIYYGMRALLESQGLEMLSQILALKMFYSETVTQETKGLELVLERIPKMDEIHKRIIKSVLIHRKRIIRQKKIASILK
tara:strand:- start:291 stop:542 length:252 start_codon:yes stop_codon:yes gene_type:complete